MILERINMFLELAPIQGITEANYRNEFARLFGSIDAYYTPFISPTSEQEFNNKFFDDIKLEDNKRSINIIPQLLGNDPEHLRLYAHKIFEMGYKEINWNIGCPFPNITRKKKGAGILSDPDLVDKCIDALCQTAASISVKMRLGYKDKNEGLEVIKRLNNFPLKKVIIHGRTAEQQYTGQADLSQFAKMCDLSDHKISYNGDIFNLDDYNRFTEMFPSIDSIMLGRGALRNPFLPSQIKGLETSHSGQIKKLMIFHELIYKRYYKFTYSDFHFLNKMKEFWRYMHVYLDPDQVFIRKIRLCQTVVEYDSIVKILFDSAKNKNTLF